MSISDISERAGEKSPAPLRSGNPPRLELLLWPHRSLSRRGFATVMKVAAAGLALPLVASFRSPVFWMLLPFIGVALAALWWSIRRNNHDATLTETLRLWPDLICVERREPDGRIRRWQANPYWVRTRVHTGTRIENYLTLKGNGREIELGAFLTPEERLSLRDDIETALLELRRAPLSSRGDNPTDPQPAG